MMTREKVWENRDRILRNTRNLLERVKGKRTKFKEQTKKVMKESSDKGLGIDRQELKKVQWVLQNKFIPMLKKVAELQKDMEWLDSSKFGKWDIPQDQLDGTKTEGVKRRTLKEDIIDRFTERDIDVKKWKEGMSHPNSKIIGTPLQFIQYSLPYILSQQGTKSFYDLVDRKHPRDFVWGFKDGKQTVVMVLVNPNQQGLEINGVRPIERTKETSSETPLETSSKTSITEKDTLTYERVQKFKPQWDDLRKDLYYPSGRNRGIEDHTHTYTWNQLGTPQSQEELLQRMKKKRPPMSGMWYDTWMMKELPDEGKTLVINKWGFDSSD